MRPTSQFKGRSRTPQQFPGRRAPVLLLQPTSCQSSSRPGYHLRGACSPELSERASSTCRETLVFALDQHLFRRPDRARASGTIRQLSPYLTSWAPRGKESIPGAGPRLTAVQEARTAQLLDMALTVPAAPGTVGTTLLCALLLLRLWPPGSRRCASCQPEDKSKGKKTKPYGRKGENQLPPCYLSPVLRLDLHLWVVGAWRGGGFDQE